MTLDLFGELVEPATEKASRNPKPLRFSKRNQSRHASDGGDSLYTPAYALCPEMVRRLHEVVGDGYVWEPFAGTGVLTAHLKAAGFRVVSTTIRNEVREIPEVWCDAPNWDGNFFTAPDCLRCRPEIRAIVSNPPYSISDPITAQCMEFKGAVALLMPTSRLHGVGRHRIYRESGFPSVFVPDNRINFIAPNGGKSAWFNTSWFCWGLGDAGTMIPFEIDRQLNPADLRPALCCGEVSKRRRGAK